SCCHDFVLLSSSSCLFKSGSAFIFIARACNSFRAFVHPAAQCRFCVVDWKACRREWSGPDQETCGPSDQESCASTQEPCPSRPCDPKSVRASSAHSTLRDKSCDDRDRLHGCD